MTRLPLQHKLIGASRASGVRSHRGDRVARARERPHPFARQLWPGSRPTHTRTEPRTLTPCGAPVVSRRGVARAALALAPPLCVEKLTPPTLPLARRCAQAAHSLLSRTRYHPRVTHWCLTGSRRHSLRRLGAGCLEAEREAVFSQAHNPKDPPPSTHPFSHARTERREPQSDRGHAPATGMPVTPLGPAPHRRHGDVVAPLGCSPRVLARVPEIARDDPACTTLTRLLNTHTRTHTHTHPARPLRGVPTPPLCAGDTGPALKKKCARPRKEVRAARVGATGAGLRRRRGPRRPTPHGGRWRCGEIWGDMMARSGPAGRHRAAAGGAAVW